MALVFFDLDGTLVRGLSSEKRFFTYLVRGRIVRVRQLAAFLCFALRWLVHFRTDVWKKNKAYLAGLKIDEIQTLAQQFVTRVLLADLRPVVRRHLENHLSQGDTVALLTGAPDFIAGPIAQRLGIAHVAATVCHTKNGCFTSRPPVIHPFGADKAEIVRQVCRTFNTTPASCAAYADSASDIALLALVAKPVAVCPDRRLRRMAERRGWQIIG
ncbi:MAG: HAD family phosphatase [Desulfobacteraceae bacterium]|jgi:HAD superfamily hydrolase (TIGR01490 family)